MGSVVIGMATGMAVCFFGMWAFLKGQRSMAEIYEKGKPETVGPAAVIEKIADARGKRTAADYARQLQALVADPFLQDGEKTE